MHALQGESVNGHGGVYEHVTDPSIGVCGGERFRSAF